MLTDLTEAALGVALGVGAGDEAEEAGTPVRWVAGVGVQWKGVTGAVVVGSWAAGGDAANEVEGTGVAKTDGPQVLAASGDRVATGRLNCGGEGRVLGLATRTVAVATGVTGARVIGAAEAGAGTAIERAVGRAGGGLGSGAASDEGANEYARPSCAGSRCSCHTVYTSTAVSETSQP